MNQVKEALWKRANGLRAEAAGNRAHATQLEHEASEMKCRAKQADMEAAEFDRLLAIYEAAK